MLVRAIITFSLLALISPLTISAATLRADQSLFVEATSTSNAYLIGTDVAVNAPIVGDLISLGTNLSILAPVAGDVLAIGTRIRVDAPVANDMRMVGGQIVVSAPVAGEIALLGGVVRILDTVHEARIAGVTVDMLAGATGPVTVYGNHVSLAGEFFGNVRVVTSDQVTIAEGTIMHGTFEYNSPQEAMVPDSAVIDGDVRYVGSASFLPTAQEAHTFAVAGIGIFFVVRVIAAMVTAGLLAGLFPLFTRRIAQETTGRSVKHSILMCISGFGVLVITPLVCMILLVSIVGTGVALLLGSAYLFLLFLAYLYSAVVVGTALSRLLLQKMDVSWHHGVFGMLALYLVGLIPVIGFVVTLIALCSALGAMLYLFYLFAFTKDELHG